MSLLTSSSADRPDACRTAVAASLAAAADSLATIDSGRSQSTPSPLFSTSSLDSCATPQPSNDFAQLLADARDRDGTVLFADTVALVALSHSDRSLLNPRCGALTNDILQYRLQPLVRVPHLIVCGAGGDWEETDALPLSATSPAEWVGLEGKSAVSSSAVVRQGELLLTGGLGHDCSILSPRTCRWRDGSPMPRKRSIHCSAQLGGVSVVCGGWDSVVALSSTLLLPADDAAQWTKGCAMADARYLAGGAVVAAADASAHRVLVVGGAGWNHRSLDSCELYDAAADRWSMQDARLPLSMCCHAAPIAGGGAVLAVQSEEGEQTQCALFDVRCSSPSWQPMAPTADARSDHAVAVVGEYSVALLGGFDSDLSHTDTAQLYDNRADRWSERAEWRLPKPSTSHCAAVIE